MSKKKLSKTALAFTALLASIGKTLTTMRRDVQKACVLAIKHFNTSGDTVYINRLMKVGKEGKGINSYLLLSYLLAMSDTKYNKKTETFSQRAKGDRKIIPITGKWYDVPDKDKIIKPLDGLKRLKATIKVYQDSLTGDDGKSTVDSVITQHILNALTTEFNTLSKG